MAKMSFKPILIFENTGPKTGTQYSSSFKIVVKYPYTYYKLALLIHMPAQHWHIFQSEWLS